MKPFDDLTDDQIASLSETDLARYIDIECAEAGVELPPELPPAPAFSVGGPEQTVYQIMNLTFLDQKDALEVVALANRLSRVELEYIPGPNFKKRTKPATDTVFIHPEQVYSADQAAKRTVEIAHREQEIADFNALRAKHDEILKKREKIATGIYQALSLAKQRNRQKTDLVAAYARYLDLTDNNRRTAARYLEKTYGGVARELCPELFEFSDKDGPDIVRAAGKRGYDPESNQPMPEAVEAVDGSFL